MHICPEETGYWGRSHIFFFFPPGMSGALLTTRVREGGGVSVLAPGAGRLKFPF